MFRDLRTVPRVRHSHIPALQRQVLLRRCRLIADLLLQTIENTFADALRAIPPGKVKYRWVTARASMIGNPPMKYVASDRGHLENRGFSLMRPHLPRARALTATSARRSLGKISDLDPDHEGEIQSNHCVDLTQPRALAQRISVAHISTTQPFYKSRYLISSRFRLWTVSFRFIT